MLTLIHSPNTRSSRILWLLEELGLPHEVRHVRVAAQDGSTGPDPANPHPDGKVPALIHDGALVTESPAIAIYLNDLAPGSPNAVPAGDPLRGAFLTWLVWYSAVFEPVQILPFLGVPESPQLRRNFRGKAEAEARIRGALGRGPWLLGDRFTAVDTFFASTGLWMRALLPEGAAVDAYLARAAARPALARARAKETAPA